MDKNLENRQMPIFLSSTFRDMQEERDELIKRIFPQLQALAQERLVTLIPIDLRWGITEEESKNGRVIELCLKEIERCQPFFIGIIGDNYGWCPSMSDFKNGSMLFDQYEWLKEDIAEGLSITEIEMQYAALRNKHHPYAFFFIKKNCMVDKPKDSKLCNLVYNIISRSQEFSMTSHPLDRLNHDQNYYAYYDSVKELGQLVQKVVLDLLDSMFPLGEEKNEWIRENQAQQAYLQSLWDIYIPQTSNEINTYLLNQMNDRYLMVSSDENCFYGKSAFLANWVRQKQMEDSHHFIYHFIGAGYFGGNYEKILKRICMEVSQLYGLTLPSEEENGHKIDYSSTLTNLLNKIRDQKPLFIILDGLQHLSDYNDAKMLDWLPIVPENVSLVVTAPYHDTTREVFYRRYGYVICLDAFKKDEELQFIENYLGKFGKKFSIAQTNTVLNAYSEAKPSPFGVKDILTLKSLLNELIIFGSYELLDKQIAYYCEDNLTHFYSRYFARMEEDFGYEDVKNIICLIAFSRTGLSESEIIRISEVSTMQWSYIHYAISHLLTIRSGKYYIDKITITNQIIKRYGKEERQIRMKLIGHFKQLTDWPSVEECLFQYRHLKDWDSLYMTLLDLNVFAYLYNNSGVAELLPYWKFLYDSGKPNKYRIAHYADLSISISEENAHILADIGQFAKHVLGDKQSAKSLFIKSKDIYESIYHADYETMAMVYKELKMYDNALLNLNKILNLAKFLHTEKDTYYPTLLSNKATILLIADQTYEAIELWNEASELFMQAKGEVCMETLGVYRNLAAAYGIVKDYNKSKDFIEKNISISKKIWGEKHVLTAEAFFLYATYHEVLGHYVEAENFYNKAQDIYTEWYPKNHAKVLETKKSIMGLRSDKKMGHKKAIIVSIYGSLSNLLKKNKQKYPLSEEVFEDILNFFEGIADDLYLVDEDWEDGMKEYEYVFKYEHDCTICNNRFVFGPSSNHIYICVDSSGIYHSTGGKTFDNLKDAQVNYLMRWYDFYEQYCDYKGI